VRLRARATARSDGVRRQVRVETIADLLRGSPPKGATSAQDAPDGPTAASVAKEQQGDDGTAAQRRAAVSARRFAPEPHLLRDWARACHICIGTGSPLPHLHRDRAHPLPHLHRDLAGGPSTLLCCRAVLHHCIGSPCTKALQATAPAGRVPIDHIRDWAHPLPTSAPGLGSAVWLRYFSARKRRGSCGSNSFTRGAQGACATPDRWESSCSCDRGALHWFATTCIHARRSAHAATDGPTRPHSCPGIRWRTNECRSQRADPTVVARKAPLEHSLRAAVSRGRSARTAVGHMDAQAVPSPEIVRCAVVDEGPLSRKLPLAAEQVPVGGATCNAVDRSVLSTGTFPWWTIMAMGLL
jgi:hypothetical protein